MNEIIRTDDIVAEERTSLITLPDQKNSLAVFTASVDVGIDTILKGLRARIDEFEATAASRDMKNEADREAVRKFAFAVTKAKTTIEAEGKRLADEQKKIPNLIDAARRYAEGKITAWRDDVRRPLTDWEAAEKARTDKHKAALENIAALGKPLEGTTAETLRTRLAEVSAIVVGTDCGEFITEYAIAKETSVQALTNALARAEKAEADAAELAKLRAADEARKAKEREDELRREGEERAKREAAEKAEADRIEKERIEEENKRLKQEADDKAIAAAAAERQKIADEKKAAEDAERAREKDRKHKAEVNAEVLKALTDAGVGKDIGKLIVKLIASGQVPHTKISY